MNWYDSYPHLGYDWDGKQITKQNHEDQLDYFLKRMEDPNFWLVSPLYFPLCETDPVETPCIMCP